VLPRKRPQTAFRRPRGDDELLTQESVFGDELGASAGRVTKEPNDRRGRSRWLDRGSERDRLSAVRKLPVACDTSAFGSSEAFAAHLDEGRRLLALATERNELADGWALRLPGDDATILACAYWILGERRCCPFLSSSLESKPDGELWMRIAGPEGTKEVLRAELA
jgi:hypothetical protein